MTYGSRLLQREQADKRSPYNCPASGTEKNVVPKAEGNLEGLKDAGGRAALSDT